MRAMRICICTLCGLAAAAAGQGRPRAVPEPSNLLTRYLDRADIHPPTQVARLTVFPITLSRRVGGLGDVLTMQEALGRGVLAVEELDNARISEARFTNKSDRQMIFLMAGELITGGKQNRTLRSDALLAPKSSVVLPLYCVQKGRWEGGKAFEGRSTVVPQAVREKAAGKAGQDAIWSEVGRANRRLGAESASGDLAVAMAKPANVRRLAELRRKITPHLPRSCVGVVVAVGRRIVGAALVHNAELFSRLRDKVFRTAGSEAPAEYRALILRYFREVACRGGRPAPDGTQAP